MAVFGMHPYRNTDKSGSLGPPAATLGLAGLAGAGETLEEAFDPPTWANLQVSNIYNYYA